MDKKESSLFKELQSGYRDYIFYSLKDFKDEHKEKSWRNGIIGHSMNKINIKLNPEDKDKQILQNNAYKIIFENIKVNPTLNNISLEDRTGSLLCDTDMRNFLEEIFSYPKYGKMKEEYDTEKIYDLLFNTGFYVKPILMYKLKTYDIELIGFTDDLTLHPQPSESLIEKINSVLKKRSSDFS